MLQDLQSFDIVALRADRELETEVAMAVLEKNCTLESRKFFIDRFILINKQLYLCTIVIFSSSADTFINI